jgi:S1-C subfamily serine protease
VRSGLGRARGALVGAVKAANGALDVGDVITSLDGEPVRDFPALARHAAGHRRGSQRTAPWRSENRGAAIRQIA